MSVQGTNVGSVFFDVGFNQASMNSGIKKSANNIQNSFGKSFGAIGRMAAAAFSIAAITRFSNSAIELGSDLAEVQNVVDVAFGESSKVIDSFAQTAISKFGLSELAAKQYNGTMGAMLKSMGLGSSQVVSMSTAMTGLAGDIASFYNLSTDEAFQKIRAGISGETEPLKQLGVNLSVANLEAYALKNGIKESYNSMSESNKALLRYNYLMQVTADAQGDFARTSDSWANQTRVLKLQWDSFKSSLGQAFIAVLTPTVRGLNTLLSYATAVANVLKNLVLSATGTSTAVSGAGAASKAAASNVSELTDSLVEATKAAESALAPFDTLNILSFGNVGNGLNLVGMNDSIAGSSAIVEAFETQTEESLSKIQKSVEEFFKRMSSSKLFRLTIEPLIEVFTGKTTLADALKKSLLDDMILGLSTGWLLLKSGGPLGGVFGLAIGYSLSQTIASVMSGIQSGLSLGDSLKATVWDDLTMTLVGGWLGISKLGGAAGGVIGIVAGFALSQVIQSVASDISKGLSLGESLKNTVWDNIFGAALLGGIMFKSLGVQGGLIGLGLGFYLSVLVEEITAGIAKGKSMGTILMSTMSDNFIAALGGAFLGFKLGGVKGGLIGLVLGLFVSFVVQDYAVEIAAGKTSQAAIKKALLDNLLPGWSKVAEMVSPGFSGRLIGDEKVPAYASGGIVRKPTLALVGEAGPEMIIPMSKLGMAGFKDLPFMANGGEVDRPTLAMIGESGKEAVIPLEQSDWAASMSSAIVKGLNFSEVIRLLKILVQEVQDGKVLAVDKAVLARIVSSGLSSKFKAAGHTVLDI